MIERPGIQILNEKITIAPVKTGAIEANIFSYR